MRDVLLILIVTIIVPFCVYRPWIGILAWSWLGYMNPHRLTWGVAYDLPFAQVVALATLIGFGAYAIRERGIRGILAGPELKLLLLLWLIFTLSTLFALRPDDAWLAWGQITKILLMVFLTAFLIDDEKKLRYLLLTIAFSIGFYGIKGGIFSVVTAGQYRIWGPTGSFIEDNNALALALNMTLPLMYYLAQTEQRTWLRVSLYASFGLSVLSVLFTYSRGGFVGLLVVLTGIFLATRLRWKVLIVIAGIISIPAIVSQMPDSWTARMSTIETYQQDGSALSRLQAWEAAWNLALDRPLIGGGFQALDDYTIYVRYNPNVLTKIEELRELGVHVSGIHSIYFEFLAENGFPGLLVFLVLCLILARSVNQLASKQKNQPQSLSIAYGIMLRISLMAYLVCGTFLEMASFDLFYQIVVLTVVAKRIFLPSSAKKESATNKLVAASRATR